MSDCGNSISVFDNPKYKDLLQDEKFIEYIISKLKLAGIGNGLPLELIEGNKITILDQSVAEQVNKYTISYLDVVLPLAVVTVTPDSIEKGIVIAVDALAVSLSYTKKTYPLTSVIFQDTNDTLNQNATDLVAMVGDETRTEAGTNASSLGITETAVASIVVTDNKSNQITKVGSILRPNRWYWGITTDPDLNNLDVINDSVATGLGTLPSTIAPNVGNGNYVWIASVNSKDITDTTLKLSQLEATLVKQLTPVAGYNVNYNLKRTNLKSGGTINLLIS
jgi:hypothetical protein